jgi:hypothetical protein
MSSFNFSISILTPSYLFSIPLVNGGTYNFTVDWGDSNPSDIITTYDGGTHTYSIPGTYIISMSGTCTQFDFLNGFYGPLNSSLVRQVLSFEDMGFTILSFGGCTNLVSIADNMSVLTNLNTAENMFSGCYSLLTIFGSMFSGSAGITSFKNTFANCTNIFIQQDLPSEIFSNNTAVTDFTTTFLNCVSLKSVPTDLFTNNLLATTFQSTFQGSGIVSLSTAGVFQQNSLVINFSSTFASCKDLQLNQVIFCQENQKDLRFINKSVNFSSCFYECFLDENSHGTSPDLWNYNFGTETPIKTNCYFSVKYESLTNSSDIPKDWL